GIRDGRVTGVQTCALPICGPARRFRHGCSCRYLRISPLHLQFHAPPPHSSTEVSEAASGLSPEISLPTCHTAYEPFTPSNSEQRWPPTSYRGCWHVVSRGFLYRYRQSSCEAFFPVERGLHTEMLHPPRGVAASGFRPLCKIPHCCLP